MQKIVFLEILFLSCLKPTTHNLTVYLSTYIPGDALVGNGLRRAILGDTGAVGVSSDFFGNNGDAVLFWRCNNGAGNKPLDKRQYDAKKKKKKPRRTQVR